MSDMIYVGEGEEFESIGAALAAVAAQDAADPQEEPVEVTIHLQPGVYREKVEIRRDNLCLEGDYAGETVISPAGCAAEAPGDADLPGGMDCTVLVLGNRVSLRHLTVESTADPGNSDSPSVVLAALGSGLDAEDCRILGSRTALFAGSLPDRADGSSSPGLNDPSDSQPETGSRQNYRDCYLAGEGDIILGSSPAYFERCTLFSRGGETDRTAAGSSPEGQKDCFTFASCRFIGAGRPGRI